MKKFTDLALSGPNTNDQIERGEIAIDKGTKLMGLRLKCVVPLANSSGGAVTLSDAQKRTLLGLLVVERLDYGKGGKFAEPFVDVTFAEMRRHQRRCYRNEMEGFGDTVKGLQRSLPNSATTSVEFTVILPLGKWAAFEGKGRNRWGMGRSQAASLGLKVRRASGTNQVLTGVVISGTVAIELYDDALSCSGDVWNPVPTLHKHDDAKLEVILPEGLPLAIDETSATHANNTLTNTSLRIDEQYIHRQVSLAQALEELLDYDTLPAAALLTDEVTVIYETAHGQVPFDQMLTGEPRFKQETRTNASLSLMYTFLPIEDAAKVAMEVRNVAVEGRKKDISAISGARHRGESLPTRLMPFSGMTLTDKDDREFETFPGLLAQVNNPTAPAAPHIPSGLLAAAQQRVALHKGKGEDKAATKVIDEVAASIPSAVSNSRGFVKGNSVVRAAIGERYFR